MIWVRIKREPAVVLGAVGATGVALSQALADGLTWQAAVPLVVGVCIRGLVTPVAK